MMYEMVNATPDGILYQCRCGLKIRSAYPPEQVHHQCPLDTMTGGQPIQQAGPGTELTAILGKFGIRPGGCACKAAAAEMDRQGPAWCRKNIPQIAAKMYQQAKKRKMPLASLSTPAIRLLIRWAIRRAEARSV